MGTSKCGAVECREPVTRCRPGIKQNGSTVSRDRRYRIQRCHCFFKVLPYE